MSDQDFTIAFSLAEFMQAGVRIVRHSRNFEDASWVVSTGPTSTDGGPGATLGETMRQHILFVLAEHNRQGG